MTNNSKLKRFLFCVLAFLSLACLFGLFYVRRNFVLIGTNPIAQILFHTIVQIDGADPTFIKGIVRDIVIIPFIGTILIYLFVYGDFGFLKKLHENVFFRFLGKWSIIFSLIAFIICFGLLSVYLKLPEYIRVYTSTSSLYEDEYVDPAQVKFVFPEKKRNLIYIFLESVETSDYSKEQGGALNYNCIPELYDLAEKNLTFNHNKGYEVAPGASWTVASMIAQSSGIPLNIPIGENDFVTSNKFLPGAYSLGEVLEKEGYNNELIIGSDAVFSGRKYYYEMHGNYTIHDYNYFCESGRFDSEKAEWWGMIDRYLWEMAKEDLLELSKKDEPFNLTLLTVDTHHQDGIVCPDCRDEFPDQLANVYACSSRKVADFIDWCKKQDFYKDTTIVIVGDHCSMSTSFDELIGDFDRKAYYTIINSAIESNSSRERKLSAFDFYPTTLSAMGVEFEGDKLGLGVDLFSGIDTLCEKYGKAAFFELLKEHSIYYDNKILYGFE